VSERICSDPGLGHIADASAGNRREWGLLGLETGPEPRLEQEPEPRMEGTDTTNVTEVTEPRMELKAGLEEGFPCQIHPTVSTPVHLFQKIYADIMQMSVGNNGYKFIIAVSDDLSGICEAHALTEATSQAIADFFWEQIYC
jgi:hypothetical protein